MDKKIADNFLQFKSFNDSRERTFFPKNRPLPNLHMSAICKLGKGIKHAKG